MFHVNAWGLPYVAVHGRRQAGLPGRGARRQVAVRVVRVREGHGVGRRAHRLARPARLRGGQQAQVQHDDAHRDRRFGLPAGDDPRLQRAVRRAGAARLGHDRDEPARHGLHLQGQAPGDDAGRALCGDGQARPRDLRRRHEDRRRRRQGAALGRRGFGRTAGARTLDHHRYFKNEGGDPLVDGAGSRPATWPRSTPTASCRSPTAART